MNSIESDVKSIFGQALEFAAGPERAAFLDEACRGNATLRAEVGALLEALDKAGDFMPLQAAGDETTARQPPREGPGTRIGRYKLLQELGEGGMGTVFMAEQQEPVRRLVALKVIKAGMDSKEVLARFEAERQAIALMDHPNIAKVLDAGTVDQSSKHTPCTVGDEGQIENGTRSVPTTLGRPFFVMELVKGVPITKYCDEHQLSPRERLELFVPVCQAIQHAHQKGVIHRDIKPSNVLVAKYDGKPVPKVIDFGVAKAMGQRLTDQTLFTGFGHIVGTLEYMSPEQAELNALDIDTRSDVYALGVLLYELLTGSTPLSRKRLKQAALGEALRLIREEEPPKPSTRLSTTETLPSIAAQRKTEPAKLTKMMRGELDWIVMQALEKDRSRRYESASAFAADVQRYLRDEPVAACPPSAAYRLRKFVRRHRASLRTALAASLVVLMAVVGISWALWDRAAQEETRQAELSRRQQKTEQTVNVARVKAEQLRDRAGELPRVTIQDADALVAGWAQAEAALGQAEAAMKTGLADARLQQQVLALRQQLQEGRKQAEGHRAHVKKKAELLRDLDEARMAYSVMIDNQLDYPGSAAKYAAAFAAYGLEVKPGRAEELAHRIRSQEPAVREALIVGLDVWFRIVSQAKTNWLLTELRTLAGAADDDDWRREFRKASSANDRKKLLSLSGEARRSSLPPANLHLLARGLRSFDDGRDEALALLRWACSRYPADFWIAFDLGVLLANAAEPTPADIEERIGCFRVALALRPDASVAHNNLGTALAAKKELDEAVAAYRKAIETNPKFAMAYNNLGITLDNKKQYKEAIAAHRKAIEINPKYADAYTHLGIALRDMNRLDEAIAAYRKAIEINSNDVQTYIGLGNALQAKNLFDEAIAAYGKAIEINPKFAVAYNNLGNALNHKKQLGDAIAAYREAIEIKPKYAAAYYNLGLTLREKNQLDEAITAYRKAIDLDPNYAEAYNDLGIALLAKNKVDEAIAAHRKSVDIDPKDGRAYFNLGIALRKNKQLDEAIAAYRKAIEIAPKNWPAYINLGVALRENKQLDEAIAAYRKAIEINPKFELAYSNLGSALRENKQLDEAIAACRKAIAINPKYAGAYDNLGDALRDNNQLDEAVAAYRKAIELNPRNAGFYNDLGFTLAKMKRFGEAIDAYAKAIDLEPKNVSRLNSLAWLLATHPDLKVRNPVKAVELATKAVGLAPKVGNCWNTLGVAHYRAGDWKAALAALEKSTVLRKGGTAEDWFFVAMAHWQLGEKEKAREWHDRAVKWMNDNQKALEQNKTSAEELGRFRAESAELLGIANQPQVVSLRFRV